MVSKSILVKRKLLHIVNLSDRRRGRSCHHRSSQGCSGFIPLLGRHEALARQQPAGTCNLSLLHRELGVRRRIDKKFRNRFAFSSWVYQGVPLAVRCEGFKTLCLNKRHREWSPEHSPEHKHQTSCKENLWQDRSTCHGEQNFGLKSIYESNKKGECQWIPMSWARCSGSWI